MKKPRIFAGLMILMLLLAACQPAAVSTQSVPATVPATTPGYPPADPTTAYLAPQPDTPNNGITMVDGYPVLPGDENKAPGSFFIEKGELRSNPSNPAQTDLFVAGQLPTQCHEVRAYINPPNENKTLVVRVYSVADTGKVCTQALQPYEGVIATFTDIPAGTYTVFANDMNIGEIAIP